MGLFGCNSRDSEPKHRAREPSVASAASTAATTAGTAPPRGPSQIRTVFVVLLENKVWSEVKGNPDAPYLNGTLIPQASIAEGYRAPRDGAQHPSEPNYVWLEAGDNLGIGDDREPEENHQDTTDHLVSKLERAGISWRSYQEDIAGDECPLTRHGTYAPKHNPMVFFDDVTDKNDPHSAKCIAHMRPLGELESDLASGKVARYNFVTPNLCNDMHTACDPLRNVVKQGDLWLATWMPKILGSSAWRENGVVFITWDEAEIHEPDCFFADCPIGLLALSPLAKGGGFTTKRTYDHGSLLRSLQEIFGVYPFIRSAARATDLSELFTSFP
jgi:hypothetical protein